MDSPRYKSRRFDGIPYLDTSAAVDHGSLVLNIVNRHADQPIEVEFELQDKQFGRAIQATELNGPGIKSENTFDDAPVKPVSRSVSAEGKMLRYRFPAHSYTMLQASVA